MDEDNILLQFLVGIMIICFLLFGLMAYDSLTRDGKSPDSTPQAVDSTHTGSYDGDSGGIGAGIHVGNGIYVGPDGSIGVGPSGVPNGGIGPSISFP